MWCLHRDRRTHKHKSKSSAVDHVYTYFMYVRGDTAQLEQKVHT